MTTMRCPPVALPKARFSMFFSHCCLPAIGWTSRLFLPRRASAAEDVPYGVGSWTEALGNQRARIQVAEKADAVWVHLPWRRHDRNPENKNITIVDAATGKTIENVARAGVNREAADLVFQPATRAGRILRLFRAVYGYAGLRRLLGRLSAAEGHRRARVARAPRTDAREDRRRAIGGSSRRRRCWSSRPAASSSGSTRWRLWPRRRR